MKQTIKYGVGSIITDIKGREFLYLGKALLYKDGSEYHYNRNSCKEAYLRLDDMESVVSYNPVNKELCLKFNGIQSIIVDTYMNKKRAVFIKNTNLVCSILKVYNKEYADVYRIRDMQMCIE